MATKKARQVAQRLRAAFRAKYDYVSPLPEDAEETLRKAEQELGFRLPPVMRFFYKYAGEDFIDPEWSIDKYLSWSKDPIWPRKLVPLAEEGCGIWLCVDCSRKRAPVLFWRGDLETEDATELNLEHVAPSFVEWLRGRISRDEGGYA